MNEEKLTLRIHRGRAARKNNQSSNSVYSVGSTNSAYLNLASPSERISRQTRKHNQIKISVSYPSTEAVSVPVSPTKISSILPVSPISPSGSNTNSIYGDKEMKFTFNKGSMSAPQSRDHSPKSNRRPGRRNIKIQVKKFRMETKAAKTLAIIVGGFVFCWCPFFTIYLIRAFCNDCINQILFSILFWLGYCNSAVNPVLYALFSRDFRLAFKKIICKFFCNRRINATTGILLRQLEMSNGQMRPIPFMAPLMISPFMNRSAEEIRYR